MSECVKKSTFRKQARQKYWSVHDRSDYECADCGRCEDELLEHFEVHHIDGDVSNNSVENLIGLCQVCHNLREGKRASVRKTSHLIGQFSGEVIEHRNAVPVCRSREEYSEYVESCFEQHKPALVIDKKRARKWMPVEVDLNSIHGSFELQTDDGEVGVELALTDEACSMVNAVLSRYENVDTGGKQVGNFRFPEESASGFYKFPGMSLNNAQSLASELKMIFESPINWRVKESELRWHFREHEIAKIQMKQLDWLPQDQQREPWTIQKQDLASTCPRCDDVMDQDAEHCKSCEHVLRWKYSACDHEDIAPMLDEPYWKCADCEMQKPDRPTSRP